MDAIADLETESSLSQENSWPSSKLDSQIDTSYEEELQSIEESVNDDEGQRFDETTVGNETFCLVPKDMAKYVPAYLTKKEILEGVKSLLVLQNFTIARNSGNIALAY